LKARFRRHAAALLVLSFASCASDDLSIRLRAISPSRAMSSGLRRQPLRSSLRRFVAVEQIGEGRIKESACWSKPRISRHTSSLSLSGADVEQNQIEIVGAQVANLIACFTPVTAKSCCCKLHSINSRV
jgi:hypothetical protein